MKIFCTGNLNRKTIAYGLSQLGTVDTGSISTGWDFKNEDTLQRLRKKILDYNVFVNSAFIDINTQETLCDLVYAVWTEYNIRGHIFNLGTTLENTDDMSPYAQSKRKLREYTLTLSENTGYTGVKFSYLVIGGVGEQYVTPLQIAQTIHWIVLQKVRIPLIQIDSQKT